jgi:predicted nucleic acid-binding protein
LAAVIADTSALVAWFVRTDVRHRDVDRWMSGVRRDLIVSPYVVAELDYVVAREVGPRAATLSLVELSSGAYTLASFGIADLQEGVAVLERYPDQAIGITDASLVVLADRYRTRDILTFDYRHFDVIRPLAGGRFRLLPRDWEGGDD